MTPSTMPCLSWCQRCLSVEMHCFLTMFTLTWNWTVGNWVASLLRNFTSCLLLIRQLCDPASCDSLGHVHGHCGSNYILPVGNLESFLETSVSVARVQTESHYRLSRTTGTSWSRHCCSEVQQLCRGKWGEGTVHPLRKGETRAAASQDPMSWVPDALEGGLHFCSQIP